MPIAQVTNGKYPRTVSVRFSGGDDHNSDRMAQYIAEKMRQAMEYAAKESFSITAGKIDKSGSAGQWYLWEFGLKSNVSQEYVGKIRIKQPWGGRQIWFWIELSPLPQFNHLADCVDNGSVANYLRYNP